MSKTGETNGVVAAIPEMSSAMRSLVTTIRNGFQDQIGKTLRFYHDVGARVHEMATDPDKYLTKQQKTEGQTPQQILEQAIGKSAATLRVARLLYTYYPEKDLERLMDRRNPDDDDFRIQWAHVVHLVGIADKAKRESYTAQAVEQCLSPPQLQALIKADHEGRSKRGKPLRPEKTVKAAFMAQNAMMHGLYRRIKEVWMAKTSHNFYATLLKLPNEKQSACKKDLQGTIDKIESLQDALDEQLDTARTTLARLEGGEAKPVKSRPMAMAPKVAAKVAVRAATPAATKAARRAAAVAAARARKK